MKNLFASLALTVLFGTGLVLQTTAGEVDRTELEAGYIECGNSIGIQLFERHRITIFPVFDKGVTLRIERSSNGALQKIVLERKDAKGRVVDSVQAREAIAVFDFSRVEICLILRDGQCCVDGWIKKPFKEHKVRMPLFP